MWPYVIHGARRAAVPLAVAAAGAVAAWHASGRLEAALLVAAEIAGVVGLVRIESAVQHWRRRAPVPGQRQQTRQAPPAEDTR